MGLVRSVLAEKFKAAAAPVIFLGAVVSVLPRIFRKRGLRKKDLVYYLDLCGTRSLGVVLLISALMGMVLALQGALQLRKVGTDIFVVDLVGFAVLKEFGPLMVAIIATGRAGSAFAAEIGTMKVNEEIYALKTLGVAPESFLVTPKLLAMLIAMPLLTVFSDAAGIFGGLAVGVTFMNIPFTAYVERTCWTRSPFFWECSSVRSFRCSSPWPDATAAFRPKATPRAWAAEPPKPWCFRSFWSSSPTRS